MHPSNKFTAEWSYKSMLFLKVNVTSNTLGQLIMNLYTKPTDTHQYLHCYSFHLRQCKSTISYSQALRIHHIRSGNAEYLMRVSELKSHLVNRGYEEKWVQCQTDKATIITRSQALKERRGTYRMGSNGGGLIILTYLQLEKFSITISLRFTSRKNEAGNSELTPSGQLPNSQFKTLCREISIETTKTKRI